MPAASWDSPTDSYPNRFFISNLPTDDPTNFPLEDFKSIFLSLPQTMNFGLKIKFDYIEKPVYGQVLSNMKKNLNGKPSQNFLGAMIIDFVKVNDPRVQEDLGLDIEGIVSATNGGSFGGNEVSVLHDPNNAYCKDFCKFHDFAVRFIRDKGFARFFLSEEDADKSSPSDQLSRNKIARNWNSPAIPGQLGVSVRDLEGPIYRNRMLFYQIKGMDQAESVIEYSDQIKDILKTCENCPKINSGRDQDGYVLWVDFSKNPTEPEKLFDFAVVEVISRNKTKFLNGVERDELNLEKLIAELQESKEINGEKIKCVHDPHNKELVKYVTENYNPFIAKIGGPPHGKPKIFASNEEYISKPDLVSKYRDNVEWNEDHPSNQIGSRMRDNYDYKHRMFIKTYHYLESNNTTDNNDDDSTKSEAKASRLTDAKIPISDIKNLLKNEEKIPCLSGFDYTVKCDFLVDPVLNQSFGGIILELLERPIKPLPEVDTIAQELNDQIIQLKYGIKRKIQLKVEPDRGNQKATEFVKNYNDEYVLHIGPPPKGIPRVYKNSEQARLLGDSQAEAGPLGRKRNTNEIYGFVGNPNSKQPRYNNNNNNNMGNMNNNNFGRFGNWGQPNMNMFQMNSMQMMQQPMSWGRSPMMNMWGMNNNMNNGFSQMPSVNMGGWTNSKNNSSSKWQMAPKKPETNTNPSNGWSTIPDRKQNNEERPNQNNDDDIQKLAQKCGVTPEILEMAKKMAGKE